MKLVEAGDDGRDEHFLKEGEVQNIHNVLFSLNKPTDGAKHCHFWRWLYNSNSV
jgi:hypothetical protein